MRQSDVSVGLVQAFSCLEASSEQTHGLQFGATKLNTITEFFLDTLSDSTEMPRLESIFCSFLVYV